jgi:hypothetical protein
VAWVGRPSIEVERGWRDMQQILDQRPDYHRLGERIRAHVLLCWLALLHIRIIETSTGQTRHDIRRDIDRRHAVTFTGATGTFRQTTDRPLHPSGPPLPKKIIEIAHRPLTRRNTRPVTHARRAPCWRSSNLRVNTTHRVPALTRTAERGTTPGTGGAPDGAVEAAFCPCRPDRGTSCRRDGDRSPAGPFARGG